MDFFERQDRARSKTAQLVVYFVLAVVGTIVTLYFTIVFIWAIFMRQQKGQTHIDFWDPQMLLWVGLGTVLVVGFSSLTKIMSLRDGGGAVARSLGGRKVETYTQDADERKLMNVVEEMAIASGTSVPEVYLLPEAGINAFAAGFSPDDAAVAVTRGCIEQLSRDELQGVVAHEFSHILNGDMRLNIRLMGVVYGILALTVIGEGILRSFRHVRVSGRSNGGGKGGGGGAAILAIFLIAIALYVIGYIGVFFGRLIQSAISRQREFLADASAVQFTRNPEGIAGALKRIGGFFNGSTIYDAHAQEAAHMFFANGLKRSFGGSLATHPPLEERIRAIDPQWDGKFIQAKPRTPTEVDMRAIHSHRRKESSVVRRDKKPSGIRRRDSKPPLLDPMEMIFTVGTLSAAALEQARDTRESLDDAFGNFIRSPLEARALIYALILDNDAERRQLQIAFLREDAGKEIADAVESLYPRVRERERSDYLPLIELALPALNQMEPVAAQEFPPRLRHLVEMDGQVTVFEFVVTRLVRRHFARRGKPMTPGEYIWSVAVLAEPCSQVLSALIYLVSSNEDEAYRRFHTAASVWKPLADKMQLVTRDSLDFTVIDEALDLLARGSFGLRKQVLRICADAIQDDGVISEDEAELFRALALSLDCPMPPLPTAG